MNHSDVQRSDEGVNVSAPVISIGSSPLRRWGLRVVGAAILTAPLLLALKRSRPGERARAGSRGPDRRGDRGRRSRRPADHGDRDRGRRSRRRGDHRNPVRGRRSHPWDRRCRGLGNDGDRRRDRCGTAAPVSASGSIVTGDESDTGFANRPRGRPATRHSAFRSERPVRHARAGLLVDDGDASGPIQASHRAASASARWSSAGRVGDSAVRQRRCRHRCVTAPPPGRCDGLGTPLPAFVPFLTCFASGRLEVGHPRLSVERPG
jgi:hypothetical protein